MPESAGLRTIGECFWGLHDVHVPRRPSEGMAKYKTAGRGLVGVNRKSSSGTPFFFEKIEPFQPWMDQAKPRTALVLLPRQP